MTPVTQPAHNGDMALAFAGTIKRGRVIAQDQPGYEAWLRSLENQDIEVVVYRRGERRTLSQNAWMWALVRLIAAHTGDDERSVHKDLKRLFLPLGKTSTKQLSVQQMNDYLERVLCLCAWLDVEVPDRERLVA